MRVIHEFSLVASLSMSSCGSVDKVPIRVWEVMGLIPVGTRTFSLSHAHVMLIISCLNILSFFKTVAFVCTHL